MLTHQPTGQASSPLDTHLAQTLGQASGDDHSEHSDVCHKIFLNRSDIPRKMSQICLSNPFSYLMAAVFLLSSSSSKVCLVGLLHQDIFSLPGAQCSRLQQPPWGDGGRERAIHSVSLVYSGLKTHKLHCLKLSKSSRDFRKWLFTFVTLSPRVRQESIRTRTGGPGWKRESQFM